MPVRGMLTVQTSVRTVLQVSVAGSIVRPTVLSSSKLQVNRRRTFFVYTRSLGRVGWGKMGKGTMLPTRRIVTFCPTATVS